jgi:hypothetical protein
MSALIGNVRAPNNDVLAEVWCGLGGVEIFPREKFTQTGFDPIAARNFAALLVRASEEVERMRDRASRPCPVCGASPRTSACDEEACEPTVSETR